MKEQEVVKSLGEFLVCQNEECSLPNNIFHRDFFRDTHLDCTGGKKTTHKSLAFDETPQFLSFLGIARIEQQISRKITEALQGFTTVTEAVVQTALYGSDVFKEIFNGNTQSMQEYFYVRAIQKGEKVGIVSSFSDQFCLTLSMPLESKLLKIYKEICRYSPEWEQLGGEFNFASGINSSYLQQFLARQAGYFIAHCEKLSESGKDLVIGEYIQMRAGSTQHENDAYYYSSEFTTFLTEKYEKNPSEQDIFNVMEYYLNFWQYFFVLIDSSRNAVKYFEEQIKFYNEYSVAMAEAGLRESFLSFRMWRINHRVSTYLPSLKNPFFLETYIYSYIQELIEKKLFFPDEKYVPDIKEFAKYLKDYVKFVVDKKEQFNFARYREYFEFRRKHEKLEDSLQKNKEIIYDKKHFIDYSHTEFAEGNRLAIKKYRKYQEKRAQEEEEKIRKFKAAAEELKTELERDEGEHFYEVLYANFLNYLQDNNLTPTKDQYTQYRTQLFKHIDESYIQEEEAKYRQSLSQPQAEEGDFPPERERQNNIVKEEINDAEEQVAELMGEQGRQSVSSSEASDQAQICPCCNGKPYDCRAADCQVMGCCTACMLD